MDSLDIAGIMLLVLIFMYCFLVFFVIYLSLTDNKADKTKKFIDEVHQMD